MSHYVTNHLPRHHGDFKLAIFGCQVRLGKFYFTWLTLLRQILVYKMVHNRSHKDVPFAFTEPFQKQVSRYHVKLT